MDDDPPDTPWFLKVIETLGFCCILVAVEEAVRRIFALGPAMPLYACAVAMALGTILYYFGSRKELAARNISAKIQSLAATMRRDQPQINHTFTVADLASSLDEKEDMILRALRRLEQSTNARYVFDRWEIDPPKKRIGRSTY
jgi:hypothetical protein